MNTMKIEVTADYTDGVRDELREYAMGRSRTPSTEASEWLEGLKESIHAMVVSHLILSDGVTIGVIDVTGEEE